MKARHGVHPHDTIDEPISLPVVWSLSTARGWTYPTVRAGRDKRRAGGRYTVESEADADPGIYLMHCHKVDHVRNGTSYPGGMLNAIVYTEAVQTDIFAHLMKYAGYEA